MKVLDKMKSFCKNLININISPKKTNSPSISVKGDNNTINLPPQKDEDEDPEPYDEYKNIIDKLNKEIFSKWDFISRGFTEGKITVKKDVIPTLENISFWYIKQIKGNNEHLNKHLDSFILILNDLRYVFINNATIKPGREKFYLRPFHLEPEYDEKKHREYEELSCVLTDLIFEATRCANKIITMVHGSYRLEKVTLTRIFHPGEPDGCQVDTPEYQDNEIYSGLIKFVTIDRFKRNMCFGSTKKLEECHLSQSEYEKHITPR